MKCAWQIALLGFAVVFPHLALAAESERTSLLDRPTFQSSVLLPLPAEVERPRRWNGQWWLGSEVQNYSEGKDEGTGVLMDLGVLFNYALAPWARFHFDAEARFYGSRVQTRYEDETMSSGLRLRNGYVGFGDEDLFEFRTGVLSQKDLGAPLLVNTRRAFPGIREQMTFGSAAGMARLRLWAQQTMPTSYSLNTQRAEREKTPTFLTESINLKITPAKVFEAEFYATHFRFNNLPAVVAFESSALGNTVNGDVAPNSEFKYGFEGFVLGGSTCICLTGPLSFRLGGQWLQNTAAPDRANRAQSLFLEGTLRLGQTMNITPRYTAFFNESDTSPAYYNRWQWGNNNRKGMVAQIEVEFPRYGFSIQAEYVQAAMINQDPFQFDKQVFLLGVETSHVSF
ncbi:MAG: hypothetical protein AB7N80_15565 [Bdellovibrionales bacterium]